MPKTGGCGLEPPAFSFGWAGRSRKGEERFDFLTEVDKIEKWNFQLYGKRVFIKNDFRFIQSN